MGIAERRTAILKLLCRRRHDTISNLASEFGVSERTIRRDIEVLSYTEPIYTQTGRYCGGVYVVDGYSVDRMYMSDEEISVLTKILCYADRESLLTSHENDLVKRLIANYTKPVQQ